MHETPEGYLLCVGVSIARTGEMTYARGETPIPADENGIVIVVRKQEEVFRPETMASFEGKSFTVAHPEDFVDPTNWSQLTKGIAQNLRRGTGEQENDLVADLLVTDSIAINLVKNGLREVSCGYEAEYTQTGIGRGFQSNIIGNHIALVAEGRAGSAYAINDHKGKVPPMTFEEHIKAFFAPKTKVVDAEMPPKEDKKPESKDSGMVSYDELVKSVKDLSEKVSSMGEKKPEQKDASTQPTESEPAEQVAKDADPAPEAPSMEDRMKKLEDMVASLMSKKSEDEGDDEITDEDSEEGEESEESEDENEEVGQLTGDDASRIEILAPGFKSKAKDAKGQALLLAYKTNDGKAAIDLFTGGKEPNVKDEDLTNALFVGVSEALKSSRTEIFSRTKTRDFDPKVGTPSAGAMTAEKMNEFNAKFYASKQ